MMSINLTGIIMKKYSLLLDEVTGLFRITALRSFSNVKAGDIGGLISSEDNLSHDGDAWVYEDAQVSGKAQVYEDAQVSGKAQVYENAQVSGKARVSGDARVYENAKVFGKARVSGDARVYENARVSGDAQVSGGAWVFGDARVYENAQVFGYAQVSGNARVSDTCGKDPVVITGLSYWVTVTDCKLKAGCQCFTFQEWREMTIKDILAMDGRQAVKFYNSVLIPLLDMLEL